MSEVENAPVTEGEQERKPIHRNTPVVQFVEGELPKMTRGNRGFHPRKSKYDAVYAALAENPGRWAFIGEGQSLYGALVGYRKRRELYDMSIAYRNGAVYAGYNMPESEQDEADNGQAEEPQAEAGDNEQADKPQWPISTGIESPVTAGNPENAGDSSGAGGEWA